MPRIGAYFSECPNRKVVALIEEYEVKEENVEQVIKSNHVQEDEEKSSLQSKSELEIKDSSNVMALVEENENDQKEIS